MTKGWLGAVGAVVLACTNSAAPGQGEPVKSAPVKTEPAKTEPAKTEPAVPAGEDWLVWWFGDGGWTTRWLRVDGEAASTVGEREALIVGDAGRLWQVERADSEVKVLACDCADEDKEKCPQVGTVGRLGLRARELGGDGVVEIRKADTDVEWGDSIEYGLAIVGGTQARLTLENSESGYFCGAHGVYFTNEASFDVATGRDFEAPKDWWKGLPLALRSEAARAIQKDVNECEEARLTVEQLVEERLSLTGSALGLKGGAPTITWKLAAEVMYICSPDYAMTATVTSGLIPEAAAIGLAGPLPGGVTKVLAEIGEARSLGLSRLTLAEQDRGAKLAAFAAAPERAWPVETTKQRSLHADAARTKLDEGRAATRAKDFNKAIAAFDEAIRLDDALAQAYSGRGYAYMLSGDAARARTDFNTALVKSDEPKLQAAVWFNLGDIARQGGELEAARKAYEKSQALRASKQAAEALAALGEAKK